MRPGGRFARPRAAVSSGPETTCLPPLAQSAAFNKPPIGHRADVVHERPAELPDRADHLLASVERAVIDDDDAHRARAVGERQEAEGGHELVWDLAREVAVEPHDLAGLVE